MLSKAPLVPHYIIVLLALFCICYSFWLGTVIARLIRYDGALGPRPKKYSIVPQYLKDRYAAAREVNESRMSSHSAFPGPSSLLNHDIGNMTEDEMRAAIAEEERIARLPTFVQDDCGDGEEFPHVQVAEHEVFWKKKTHPSYRANPPQYMQMGLRKLELADWLTVHGKYNEFHAARARLLEEKPEEALQVNHKAEHACEELMHEVVDFLVRAYPQCFGILRRGRGKVVVNKMTDERFDLQKPWSVHPLEVCARLAMEDFNILMKSELTGQHYLEASATLFPAGWHMRDRIGASVTSLHGPVPLWESKLARSVEKYFTRLDAKTSMQRHSFVQVKDPFHSLHETLFIQEDKDFFPGTSIDIDPSSIIIRHERQTFRRLLLSNAIVFTVHTSLQNLTDVPEHERANLVKEIRGWPEEIARYKGRDLWEKTLVGWCEGRELVIRDDRSVYSDSGTVVGDDNTFVVGEH